MFRSLVTIHGVWNELIAVPTIKNPQCERVKLGRKKTIRVRVLYKLNNFSNWPPYDCELFQNGVLNFQSKVTFEFIRT